jgi:tetratricopeptide (TPR) repeat protein
MTPEGWHQVQEIFAKACDAPVGERAALARQLAAGDSHVANEVLSLLDAASGASHYFDDLAARLPRADTAESQGIDGSGRTVGPYRLTRLLGRGGMGTVYLAERADGAFDHIVAVKLLPVGAMRPALTRRFLAERQILASMQHPHIARLLDGGVTDDETPYFVMEYVDGVPIDEYCEERAPSIDHKLALFVDLCGAVEAAHRNLVIHRDLKPHNVLVTREGTVKLLDFGIAKLLSRDDGLTEVQPLTRAYASPEQLDGGPITTAVDVWGLGVVLYELLAGRHPFEGDPPGQRTLPPPAPSRFRPGLPRDLDTIVLTALNVDPECRYASVVLLTDDVRRYLEKRPIRARAESWAYRLACFLRRHGYAFAAVAVIIALLGALTITSLRSALRAREQTVQIARERDTTKHVMKFLVDVFATADPAARRGQTITARELLDRGAARVHTELTDRPEIQATLLGTLGRVYRQLGLLDRAMPLLEEALAQRQRLHHGPHQATAEALHELGLARWDAGESSKAEALFRRALDMREALRDGTAEDTVASRLALGRLLTDLGRPAEGSRELRMAVQSARRLGNEKTSLVAYGVYHLAMALHHEGKMPQAFEMFREAGALYRRLPIEPTPESTESLLRLAGLESAHSAPSHVSALYREALAATRQLYGDDHPKYATALRESATHSARTGDLDGADAQLNEAVQIYSRLKAADQTGLARTRIELGEVLRRRGQLDAAERMLSAALAVSQRIVDPLTTARALDSLVEVHRERGQFEQAAQRLDEAAGVYRRALSPEHPMLLRVGLARGKLAHARGDHRAAQRVLRDTLQGFEALLGPDHLQVAHTRLALGTCLFESGQVGEARPLLVDADKVLRARLGPQAPITPGVTAMLRDLRISGARR